MQMTPETLKRREAFDVIFNRSVALGHQREQYSSDTDLDAIPYTRRGLWAEEFTASKYGNFPEMGVWKNVCGITRACR